MDLLTAVTLGNPLLLGIQTPSSIFLAALTSTAITCFQHSNLQLGYNFVAHCEITWKGKDVCEEEQLSFSFFLLKKKQLRNDRQEDKGLRTSLMRIVLRNKNWFLYNNIVEKHQWYEPLLFIEAISSYNSTLTFQNYILEVEILK